MEGNEIGRSDNDGTPPVVDVENKSRVCSGITMTMTKKTIKIIHSPLYISTILPTTKDLERKDDIQPKSKHPFIYIPNGSDEIHKIDCHIRMWHDDGLISQVPTLIHMPNGRTVDYELNPFFEEDLMCLNGYVKMCANLEDDSFLGVDQFNCVDSTLEGRLFYNKCLKCRTTYWGLSPSPFTNGIIPSTAMLSHCEHICCNECVSKELSSDSGWKHCPYCKFPKGHHDQFPIFPHSIITEEIILKQLGRQYNYTNPLEPRRCRVCNLHGKAICPKCKEARYCCRDHYIQDWKHHRKFCGKKQKKKSDQQNRFAAAQPPTIQNAPADTETYVQWEKIIWERIVSDPREGSLKDGDNVDRIVLVQGDNFGDNLRFGCCEPCWDEKRKRFDSYVCTPHPYATGLHNPNSPLMGRCGCVVCLECVEKATNSPDNEDIMWCCCPNCGKEKSFYEQFRGWCVSQNVQQHYEDRCKKAAEIGIPVERLRMIYVDPENPPSDVQIANENGISQDQMVHID